jgi:uncharacterized protein
MSALEILSLFLAGFATGAVNAVAGGGTFISFGALTLAGIAPIAANATSSITQFPGYVTSTLAYRADIGSVRRGALALVLVSLVGSAGGALLLLSLENAEFRVLVPWLLVAATALFAAGPWLTPKRGPDGRRGRLAGPLAQLPTAVYGGFFGAGMGIMMLATLGLTQGGDYHRLNALKNLLAASIALVAICFFVAGGVVDWPSAAAMVPGVALGGWSGVWMARRVPQACIRVFVIAVGLLLAAYYFWRG